jgi:iron complex transport system ATP-binding protein
VTEGLGVSGLRADYGGAPAVDGVGFSVGPGRVAALAGENGSGKSTLLKAIAGVVPRREGEVRLDGESIAGWPRRKAARAIAYAAQSADLVFPITVRDLVLQGRAPWGSGFLRESAEDRAIADDAMRACDVLDLAERDATRLSGGERRRAFLARLLAQQARVWLLDEPTADLDPRHRLEFLDVLREAHARLRPIVLWATHDVNEALAIADDLLLLRRGRLVAAGAVADALVPEALENAFSIGASVERDPAGRSRVTFFR